MKTRRAGSFDADDHRIRVIRSINSRLSALRFWGRLSVTMEIAGSSSCTSNKGGSVLMRIRGLDPHLQNRLPQRFALRINPKRNTPATIKNRRKHEIERAQVGHFISHHPPRIQRREKSFDRLGGQTLPKKFIIRRRESRDHADVGASAFVATAGVGDFT